MNPDPETRYVPVTFHETILVPLPPTDLPETDGEPLESNWHRLAISLLIEALSYFWRDRNDFFVGGNMFLYFSQQQIRTESYRGPDFFFVWDVERHRPRRYWALWDEAGKYPNLIIELLSPSTAQEDRTTKKDLYEGTFRTPEYFLYDPATQRLEGWRRDNSHYQVVPADERGWLWSEQLELWLGTWEGSYLETRGVWPRFYGADGHLIPIGREAEERRAEAEKQRAEAEERRAEAAEAELARLRARVSELEGGQGTAGDAGT